MTSYKVVGRLLESGVVVTIFSDSGDWHLCAECVKEAIRSGRFYGLKIVEQ